MKKRNRTKLALAKETIRALRPDALARVVGGLSSGTVFNTCDICNDVDSAQSCTSNGDLF